MLLRRARKFLIFGAKIFSLFIFALYIVAAGIIALWQLNSVVGAVATTLTVILFLATISSIQE
jgi:hypothetical protein